MYVVLLLFLMFIVQNENMEIYSYGRKFLNVVKPIAVTIFWEACGNGTAVRLRFLRSLLHRNFLRGY